MHRTVTAWLFTLTACAVVMPTAAHNTDGRWNYLAADMREWFKGLHAPRTGTPCCDEADGWRVDDVDWESKVGDYRVRVYGKWIPVPDDTVITEPIASVLRWCGRMWTQPRQRKSVASSRGQAEILVKISPVHNR